MRAGLSFKHADAPGKMCCAVPARRRAPSCQHFESKRWSPGRAEPLLNFRTACAVPPLHVVYTEITQPHWNRLATGATQVAD